MRFLKDYDFFEVGETWTLQNSEEIYVEIDGQEVEKEFQEDTDVVILSIQRDEGYGTATVEIGGYRVILGLDELYDMVMED